MKNHLSLAYSLWQQLLCPIDRVIDATVGNGKDTAKLLALAGSVIGFDIQSAAIEEAKKTIPEEHLARVRFLCASHEHFPDWIEKESIRLIVYNLGYLPGGDKNITTKVASTVQSLEKALGLLGAGGAISITCYPGHPEGYREQEALIQWVKTLKPPLWAVTHFQWLNGYKAPSLLFIKKIKNITSR